MTAGITPQSKPNFLVSGLKDAKTVVLKVVFTKLILILQFNYILYWKYFWQCYLVLCNKLRRMFRYDCVCVLYPGILLSLQSPWGHHPAAAPGQEPRHRPGWPPGTSCPHGRSQTGCYPSVWRFGSRLVVEQRRGNPGHKHNNSQTWNSSWTHCCPAPDALNSKAKNK